MRSTDSTAGPRYVSTSAWLPAALLVGSGFTALVYQVLWLRLLGLVFGVTVHAASTVLAAFMAGLAIGSFAGGRLADRVRAPMRWFGAAELLIGASALATPWALTALQPIHRLVHASLADESGVLTLVRFVGSFLVLLVPTTLMGATMPLALRAAVSGVGDFGRHAATLYAANTSGAVAGALVTGYYLIGQVGISASFRLAAAVNLTVAAVALLRPGTSAAISGDTPPAAGSAGLTLSARVRGLLLATAVASGFVGLALEIVWFRALVVFLPATTYVFTTILTLVLLGIAAGSALARRALRRPGDWVARLSLLHIATALAALASLSAQAWTYAQGWRTGAALQAAALSVLPAMILMGAAFPIALSCWTAGAPDGAARTGDRVGRFYLANLAGAIGGALAAGFILIPWLGTRRAMLAVAAASLATGLVLLGTVARRRPRHAAALATGGIVLFAALGAVLPDPIESVLARRYDGERLLWREEGAQSTVTVHAGEHRVMYLDGLHQANDSPEMLAVHRLIGTLAMALRIDARDALVIGIGGGATAGAVAQFSDAEVDVIELSPSVIRAAEWFRHANGDLLRRPNVRVRVDDGRNYLLLTQKRYDVITADIIQPIHAGAGNLYSREYFELAARALRRDGLMLQWIGHRPETQYKLMVRTFLAAFPHATAWADGTLLVGTTQPLRLSHARLRARFREEVFRTPLSAAGIHDVAGLLRLYSGGPDELRRFVGGGPVLTDDRPRLEFFRSLPREEGQASLPGAGGDATRHLIP